MINDFIMWINLLFCPLVILVKNVGQLTFYQIIIRDNCGSTFFSYITFVMNEGQLTFLSTNNSCD